MKPELNLLQAGISAVDGERYPEAVAALKEFCDCHADPQANEYFEAQR